MSRFNQAQPTKTAATGTTRDPMLPVEVLSAAAEDRSCGVSPTGIQFESVVDGRLATLFKLQSCQE